MLSKQMKKELYTLYQIEGDSDEIRKSHIVHSYCNGVAECIKYHDYFVSWIDEIVANKYKIGFGLVALTEDGKKHLDISRYDLTCSTYTANTKSEEDIGKIMGDIIEYYINGHSWYYEIEDDNIYVSKELTGHMYYRSPYESSDGCGNCNGARCDICHTKYTVLDLITETVYYSGFDKDKAELIENEYKKDYSDIIGDILLRYEINMDWFEKKICGAADLKALYKILREYKIPYITTT